MSKIEKIEIYKLNVPLTEPFIISLGTIYSAENLAIRVHTDKGVVGVGEASPLCFIAGETQQTEFEMAQSFARLLKGKDPLEIESRLGELDRAIPGNTTLKSAFDMALYDVAAQEAGMPLYKFLGGTNDRRVITDMTISINPPEYMAQQAKQFIDEGFPALKIKLGGTTKDDVARIRAIREAVGYDVPLRIDANQGWDVVTAIRTLKALEPYGIEYCEEPTAKWNTAGLARIRQESPIAIMADESVFDHHDAFKLAALGACDYINIKLSKSGGIYNALKITAVAEAAGIKCQVGCMNESRLGLTALMHLAAARRVIVHYDMDSSFMMESDPVIGGIEYLGKGEWRLHETAGLGAAFAPDFLTEMERVEI